MNSLFLKFRGQRLRGSLVGVAFYLVPHAIGGIVPNPPARGFFANLIAGFRIGCSVHGSEDFGHDAFLSENAAAAGPVLRTAPAGRGKGTVLFYARLFFFF